MQISIQFLFFFLNHTSFLHRAANRALTQYYTHAILFSKLFKHIRQVASILSITYWLDIPNVMRQPMFYITTSYIAAMGRTSTDVSVSIRTYTTLCTSYLKSSIPRLTYTGFYSGKLRPLCSAVSVKATTWKRKISMSKSLQY